ncbi:MAG: DUF502 domain-containing protein [Phycisphaerae bacterium]|nr:DUF502 domain-containing protein [Phycisphaerae bacterium]
MKKLKAFVLTTILGGVVVILPAAILLFVFKWIFGMVISGVRPAAETLVDQSDFGFALATIIVLGVIIGACFLLGLLIRTKVGKLMHQLIENAILSRFPGYSLLRETVGQLLGGKKSPFSTVALAQIYGNDTLVTAFVTDEHENGMFTVFVPTGPNPTSGNIYHLEAQYVHVVDVSVESTMRSIISCGAGSTKLVEEFGKKNPSSNN